MTEVEMLSGGQSINGVFYPYALFMESMIQGLVDFETDIFFMMLVDTSYAPNQNTHKFKSIITGELDQTYSGYSPGGQQMAINQITYTGSTKVMSISASNIQWPLVTFPSPGARYGVMYDGVTPDNSGSPGSMPLVGYVDFTAAQIITDMAFQINWPSTGMLNLKLP